MDIPMPTDNIYKFYALFGLMFFIVCIISFVSIHNSGNEVAYKNYVESETLKAKNDKSPEEISRLKILDERMKVNKSDNVVYVNALLIGALVGIFAMICGFYNWHNKVQPEQDKLLQLQIKKLEKEVEDINK
jgi:hypothetical protein